MRRVLLALGLATTIVTAAGAQWIHRGLPRESLVGGPDVVLDCERGALKLTFLDPAILRVRFQRSTPRRSRRLPVTS
jgi:hypothetical protein